MSAADMTAATVGLEKALRFLAANPDKPMDFICGKFQVLKTDVWAWLEQFNMSRKELSETRIDAALAANSKARAGRPVQAPAPQVENAVKRRQAREPIVEKDYSAVMNHALGTDSAPNKGAAPWLKKGTRPRANGLKTWRATIVGIAAGDEAPTLPSWWAFATNWFKTAKPTPGQAAAFLKWLDEKSPTPATAKNGGGIKADKPAPAVAKPAKRKYTRRAVVTAAPVPEAPLAPRGDGFKELEITYGRKVEHDARYSGDKVQSPCFSVSSRLFPLSKGKASRIRLFWNGEARTCAAILGDTAGLKMQQAHGTQRAISTQLPALFGKAEIYFKAVKAPKDYDLMFEAVAHET